MSPNVNPELVTNADLIQFKCPSCGNWQKDFIKYQCYECETIQLIWILISISILLLSIPMAAAEPLEKNKSNLVINPDEQINNDTITMNIAGIDDIEIKSSIPEDITIILQSDHVTMTNIPTEVQFPDE